ncbi:ABC transporter permease subunit [Rhodococcus globerulus]|uniref:ATP-binding cassette domain-containing protein n=1 Tax=Rhodococcus globerulus TaxID=33008 RepID=A0ABU4C3A4_RHOGO|nr:ATP-binding cassette domain-containing protein [Rhodococcus globerulus]MDV6270982.1 ATP-binding cassette domain-containing protein [Rhodococcus globerulus]
MTLLQYAFLGLSSGGAYALVSLGIVTVYRGTRIVNFAQGAVGTLGAYVFWSMLHEHGLPLPVSILGGVATGAAIGLLFYVLVGRKLAEAPVATRTLVTLGLFLAVQSITVIGWGTKTKLVAPFLASGGTTVFGVHVQYVGLLLVGLALALTIVLSAFFRWSRFGRVTSALADSPVGARALGYSPHPTGALTWIVGGSLGALAVIFVSPVTGLSPTILSVLVVPALGAALLARFTSFWIATTIAVLIGVVQSVATGFGVDAGISAAIPALFAIVALFVARGRLPGRGTTEALELFKVGSGKIRPAVLAVALVVLAVLIAVSTGSWADTLSTTAIFALVGLSVVVLVGYTGQVSLAPMALAGVAAILTGWAGQWELPLAVTIVAPVLVVLVGGLLLGLLTIRVRGIGLTIGTLALAAIVQAWVFTSETFLNQPSGLSISSSTLFGFSLDNGVYPHRFAFLAWTLVVLAALAIANLRRSRAGRRLLAVRSDERAAAASGISVDATKIVAFAYSAVLAGLAGVLLALQAGSVGGAVGGFGAGYGFYDSLALVATAVLCGAGYVMGGVLTGVIASGGVLVRILDFGPSSYHWIALLFGVNLMVTLVIEPNGITGQFLRGKDAVLARFSLGAKDGAASSIPISPKMRDFLAPVDPVSRGAVALSLREVSVNYGGIAAVSEVSFDVEAGKVLGVLGPNGAGKSSLIDALTGFVPVDSGTVHFRGDDVTRLVAHRRAERGLVRTFQDHLLFEDLSVRENLLVAAEGSDTLAWLSAPVSFRAAAVPPEVLAAADLCGLTPYLDDAVESLSLGWHARVVLARALASRPAVLCLDEPAAALSSGAREDISRIIHRAADELGIAIVLIEHNIDVILDTCDEVVVLDGGSVIAFGEPESVLQSAIVRRAYLGELEAVDGAVDDWAVRP